MIDGCVIEFIFAVGLQVYAVKEGFFSGGHKEIAGVPEIEIKFLFQLEKIENGFPDPVLFGAPDAGRFDEIPLDLGCGSMIGKRAGKRDVRRDLEKIGDPVKIPGTGFFPLLGQDIEIILQADEEPFSRIAVADDSG